MTTFKLNFFYLKRFIRSIYVTFFIYFFNSISRTFFYLKKEFTEKVKLSPVTVPSMTLVDDSSALLMNDAERADEKLQMLKQMEFEREMIMEREQRINQVCRNNYIFVLLFNDYVTNAFIMCKCRLKLT